MTDDQRVPDWLLERFALGELSDDRAAEVKRQLEAEEGGVERLDALRADNDAILEAAPPEQVVQEINRRVHLREVQEAWQTRHTRRRWAIGLAVPATMAIAAFFAVQIGSTPSTHDHTLPDDPGYEAAKGDMFDLRLFRQVPDGEDCVEQRVLRLAEPAGRLAPPVVHQHVERLETLDMMPPQRRDEDGVARLELSYQRIVERLAIRLDPILRFLCPLR